MRPCDYRLLGLVVAFASIVLTLYFAFLRTDECQNLFATARPIETHNGNDDNELQMPDTFKAYAPGWAFRKERETPRVVNDGSLRPLNSSFWFAQDKEDLFAESHFFHNVVHGVILESGALDGIRYSTSHGFEKERGWYAIHIEAGPSMYANLVQNRPKSLNLNVALCDKPRTVTFAEAHAVGGIIEFMAPSFRQQWGQYHTKKFQIACSPAGPILTMFSIKHIDFWVLDVEGGELKVLEAWDFEKTTVDVIVVEADQHSPEKDRAIIELLAKNDYHYYGHVVRNDWFVHKRFKAHAHPDATMPSSSTDVPLAVIDNPNVSG